jgi:hypothetical protein
MESAGIGRNGTRPALWEAGNQGIQNQISKANKEKTMTTKNISRPMNMSTEIPELNDHELRAVSGGLVKAKGSVYGSGSFGFVFSPDGTERGVYEDAAQLGSILSTLSGGGRHG